MKVTVAKSSGFCFGVKTAVAAAQEAVLNPPSGKPLVMLGDIVHNTMVVESLKKGGFTVACSATEVPEGAFVLIRAHGITPEEMEILKSRGCEIKDCTSCGVRRSCLSSLGAWSGMVFPHVIRLVITTTSASTER